MAISEVYTGGTCHRLFHDYLCLVSLFMKWSRILVHVSLFKLPLLYLSPICVLGPQLGGHFSHLYYLSFVWLAYLP